MTQDIQETPLDRRQLDQQKKLMEMQSQYDAIASQRNLENQLKLWDATNYPSQVAQMQKAGLSVGLMYKGGGQSGQIAADNTNRQAPTAANGGGMEIQQMIQLMLNNKMTEAQIENIKEDTKGKEINNRNEDVGGINQNVKEATIDNLKASTTNTKAKTALTNAETAGQELANAKDNATMEASIKKAYAEAEIAVNQMTESDIKTGALVNNKEEFLENYKQQLAAQAIINKLNQSQENVNNQQIKNLKEGIKLIASQTKVNEQEVENLIQQIVNLKSDVILNTIKTNQGNRQLDLKDKEIEVIKELGYMGIGTRTAVDLIDMLKNGLSNRGQYQGGGLS